MKDPAPDRPATAREASRLEALRHLRILDTPPEQAFDDLAWLASTLCGAPIALVSLVDADRQWFKACVGLDDTGTPRDIAFCAHAIEQSGLFEVPDATLDPDSRRIRWSPALRTSASTRARH